MATLKRCVPLLMAIAVGVACATRVDKVIESPRKGGPAASALLLVDRWHAGVVIKISDIPGDLVPERRDFPEAEYLEFGWGDWDFYQARGFNLGYAFKALLFPSKSVLHVVGFGGPVAGYAPYREIIEFNPPFSRFRALGRLYRWELCERRQRRRGATRARALWR